jgi:hypothetical protein
MMVAWQGDVDKARDIAVELLSEIGEDRGPLGLVAVDCRANLAATLKHIAKKKVSDKIKRMFATLCVIDEQDNRFFFFFFALLIDCLFVRECQCRRTRMLNKKRTMRVWIYSNAFIEIVARSRFVHSAVRVLLLLLLLLLLPFCLFSTENIFKAKFDCFFFFFSNSFPDFRAVSLGHAQSAS